MMIARVALIMMVLPGAVAWGVEVMMEAQPPNTNGSGPSVNVISPIVATLFPGDTIGVFVMIDAGDEPLTAFSAYDVGLRIDSLNAVGSLECEQMTVDIVNPQYPFPDSLWAGNCASLTAGALDIDTESPNPDIDSFAYLAEIRLRASDDADGVFQLTFDPILNNLLTAGNVNLDFLESPELFRDIVIVVNGDVPPPEIVYGGGQLGETSPCSGYIDPRSDSDNGFEFNQGINTVSILFSEPVFGVGGGDLAPSDFEIAETSSDIPNTVVAIDSTMNPLVVLTLDRVLTAFDWTTIIAHVQNAAGAPILSEGNLGVGAIEPDRIDVASLPGDVNQDGTVTPFDLLAFRQIVQGEPLQGCGKPEDFVDTDRNGQVTPFDLLRFRQLINGSFPSVLPWEGLGMKNQQP
jgi:dockerin type I repeat protein